MRASGKLANVVFVDPEFGTLPELRGTSNDFHPWGSLPAGENFVRSVHEALATARSGTEWCSS